MLEKDIVNAILKVLRIRGYWAEKIHGGPYQRMGTPDIIACSPQGQFIGIEVKRPGKEPTPVQLRVIAEIREAGGIAFVATSVEDVRKELEF